MRVSLGFLLFSLIFVQAGQAAYWHEAFDGFPTVAITNQVGWESLGGAVDAGAARVSDGLSYSGARSLYLAPVGLTINRRLAVYTNFTYAYTVGQDRLLRISAQVYRENLNQYLTLQVGTNATGGIRLKTDLDGTMLLNDVSAGIPWPAGEWTRIVIWHDMDNQRTALDVDGVSRISWTHGIASLTSCDQVRLQRSKLLATDTGVIYVDNLSVETVPLDTTLWWRLEESSGLHLEELTGWAQAVPVAGADGFWRKPLFGDYRPVGEFALYRNAGSMAGLVVTNIPVRAARPQVYAWTLEWFYQAGTSYTNTHDLCSLQGAPFDSLIDVQWRFNSVSGLAGLRLSLQADDSVSGAQELDVPVTILRDSLWHHVALVKDGTQLITYRDYRPVYTNQLDGRSLGAYRFGAGTQLSIGSGLAGLAMHPDFVVDEIRYTEAALGADRFIRPGGAVIRQYNPQHSATDQSLDFSCNPNRRLEVQYTLNFTDWFTELHMDSTHMNMGAYNLPKSYDDVPIFYRIRDIPLP
jgi:hypothetical protein